MTTSLSSIGTFIFITASFLQMNLFAQNTEVEGELNIAKTGVALRINGSEAMWYNGTYFSYGFGANHNYIAKPVRIGPVEGALAPFADLHIVDPGLANLSIESQSDDAVLQFTSSGNSISDDWTMRMDISDSKNLGIRFDDLDQMVLSTAGDLSASGYMRTGTTIANPQFKIHYEEGFLEAGNDEIPINLPADVSLAEVILIQINGRIGNGAQPISIAAYDTSLAVISSPYGVGLDYNLCIMYIKL